MPSGNFMRVLIGSTWTPVFNPQRYRLGSVNNPEVSIAAGLGTTMSNWGDKNRKITRAANGDLYCVIKYKPSANQIKVYKSTNDGDTWTDTSFPTQATDISSDQISASIACDSNSKAHVVVNFRKIAGGSQRIWYSNNTSGSWSALAIIDDAGSGNQWFPTLAIDGSDNVHVVCARSAGTYILYYNNNVGGSWGTWENMLTIAWVASMVIDSADDIHVAASPSDYDEIYYQKRTAGVWGAAEIIISGSPDIDQRNPAIALDASDNPHIVWEGLDGGTSETQIKYTKWNGAGWDSWINIYSMSGYIQKEPTIAIDQSNGNIYVAWYGYGENNLTQYGLRWIEYNYNQWTNYMEKDSLVLADQRQEIGMHLSGGKIYMCYPKLTAPTNFYFQKSELGGWVPIFPSVQRRASGDWIEF